MPWFGLVWCLVDTFFVRQRKYKPVVRRAFVEIRAQYTTEALPCLAVESWCLAARSSAGRTFLDLLAPRSAACKPVSRFVSTLILISVEQIWWLCTQKIIQTRHLF